MEDFQPPHLLVVDDSKIDLQLLKTVLTDSNYRVSLAQSGDEALPLALASPPDLILLDVQMPGMNGYEVCQQIKQRATLHEIPVIFLSAHSETEEKVRAFESGGVDYVTKPFQLEELHARIRTHLSLRDYQRRLEQTNQELQKTMTERNAAQTQLLQAEKMASLGTLAAGVAHEINNPIGYISANLNALQSYVTDLFALLRDYETLERHSAAADALSVVTQRKQAIDLDFLKQDLPDLLQESSEGITRVTKIVQDLKDFSHADKAERVFCDLHRGIDSTLNVVWHELKYKAQVVKEYGALPLVQCVPSQINQVVANLLVNAAHAVEAPGTIWIRTGTCAEGEQVFIEVEDTGCGIEADVVARLFEPFFTTKPIGKGTGLGLSLSHGIIEKHQGSIQVWSQPGRGSRFRVTLPVRLTTDSAATSQHPLDARSPA